MSTTETALTAHMVKPEVENEDAMLTRIRAEIGDPFGIGHVILRVERSEALIDCANCPKPDVRIDH